MKFVITGMPRTRSAWFSAYFSQGITHCYHEAAFHDQSLDDSIYAHVGTADTGYAFLPEWQEELGEHKVVVIHRDIEEVAAGLAAIGQSDTRKLLRDMQPLLASLDGLHVNFNDIDARLPEIHKYLGLPGYDKNRHVLFADMNIQSKYWSI